MSKFDKEKIVEKIVSDFNDSQILSSYWFEDSKTQIEWSRDQECYLILKADKTWNYARPKNLSLFVEDLTTKDLKEYLREHC
tara:strand:- start:2735 stop:2980 length:246 start_codon:yes stop_codon:yes gene_type:complete